MGNIFSTIVDGGQIEEAVINMLKLRYPTYLDEIAQQRGRERGVYQSPKSYVVTNENLVDRWPEDAIPSVIIISPGMVDAPTKHGDGSYTGRWYLATAVVVEARTKDSTHTLGMRYGAALRTCVLENSGLEGAIDGKAEVIDWISEDYDDLTFEESRNLSAAKNIFTIEVRDIANAHRGPSAWLPDEEPPGGGEPHSPDYGDLPTADPDKLQVDVIQNVE